MEKPDHTRSRPDYGIDAPVAVRNMFIAGSVALLVSLLARSGLLPWPELAHFLKRTGAGVAIGSLGMGCWMIYSSKFDKIPEREWLLDLIPWRGDETVLDVGCGRGVMMIGAAKRLTTGTAAGIDIWQAKDLSGNHPEAVLENAQLEGVADRVTVLTADMRQIPFPDGCFDVIVSNGAVHNINQASERETAVREIARVLKPGGVCLLADVLHEAEYANVLRTNGVTEIQRRDLGISSLFLAIVSLGRVRPFVLIARKP